MNQESRIKNQESRIKNQESRIKNQESRIKNQESRIKNNIISSFSSLFLLNYLLFKKIVMITKSYLLTFIKIYLGVKL
ncbi:hypothetical protein [Brachyspira intermedia]|uniref:hypothetical protein n=1 Tax=Brachyspira intermedia TaxID=84377 RepID=UPI00059B4C9B|nr:hypothetical protein [Brachyspira intermedia]